MFGRTNSGAGTGGGGGEKHYATIRVNTDYLFGQPVRVTGTDYDQTALFTAEGEAYFTVNDWGTYTVTADGQSVDIDVTAWYVTYDAEILNSVSITFTVEGTKEDNIQIIDPTDNSIVDNVIFPTGATSAEVTMTIPSEGKEYTFRSSVAKALDGSGNDYSKSIALFKDMPFTKLTPDGYEDLEYIESTGTQYIDTNAIFNNGLKAELDVIITQESVAGSANLGLLGWQYENANKYYRNSILFGYQINKSSFLVATPYAAGSDGLHSSTTYPINSKYNLKIDFINSTLKVDDVNVSMSKNGWNGSVGEQSLSPYIFAFHSIRVSSSTEGPEGLCAMKLYSCKMRNGDTLVRDFIPCRRTSDGAVGLYDRVTNEFYGNSGTGVFLAGKRTDLPRVMVMPDGALYWYGNECIDVTGGISDSGWSRSGYSKSAITKNANSISLSTASGQIAVVSAKNKTALNGYTKFNSIANIKSARVFSVEYLMMPTKTLASSYTDGFYDDLSTTLGMRYGFADISPYTDSRYLALSSVAGYCNFDVYAMYLE